MGEVYRFMEDIKMPVYQARGPQREAEAASQGITEMPVTPGSQCLTNSQRRARAKRVEKTCFQLYAMTRNQRDKDRKQDPPLRIHTDGTAQEMTEVTQTKAPRNIRTRVHVQTKPETCHGGDSTCSKTDAGLRVHRRSLGIHTQGYNKELATVKAIRLKGVSTSMGAYARTRRMAVRLKMLLERKRDGRCKARLVLKLQHGGE